MVVFVSTVKAPTLSSMSDFPPTPDTKKLPRQLWTWVFMALFSFALLYTVCLGTADILYVETMTCMYVAICLGSVKGNTACVFCASGLCQRDLADAVLVLQRHQHWRVRSLVQETQRSPGGHGRQGGCSWPCVWADREQPVGGWKTNQKLLFSCLTKFEFGKHRKRLLITEITARAFKKSNWKTVWSPLLLTDSLVFFCWNSIKVQNHDTQPYLSSCVPLYSWLGQRPSRTNCRKECQTPSPHWPRLTSRSGSWLEIRKVPSPNSPERSQTVSRSARMSQYDIQQCKNTNG